MTEQELKDRYPKLRGDAIKYLSIYDDWGWGNLLLKLMDKLYPIIKKENFFDDFIIFQIKEKFGGLRFYLMSETNEMSDIISEAEKISYHICEYCGTLDNIVYAKGWYLTLCENCAKENKKRYRVREDEEIPVDLLIKWKFITI